MKKLIKDIKYDYNRFEIEYDENDKEFRLEFVVNEIISWDEQNNGIEAERYLSGTIKWDGCSHIYFGDGDNNGYIHLCGKIHFDNHMNLMKELFELASKEITKFDSEVAK